MENNLFSNGIFDELVDKHDTLLEIDDVKMNAVQKWAQMLKNGELTDEISNYGNFQDIILRQLLGYSIDDIKTNYSTEGKESIEFALTNKDNEVYVAIELKGSDADLSTYRNPHKKETVMQQVARYATFKKSFKWCVASNYDTFIFFNKISREEFISFKFDELNDIDILKKFLFVFSKISLIENDLPSELLDETLLIERNLEDEFYQLYSETRLMLIKELENSSQDIDRLEAINLAQLILNRFIFLCFAEDTELINRFTIADVLLTPIEHNNLFEFTMWDRLNELFRFADKGNEEKGISAFNGGLFEKNLRHLEIRDKIDDASFFDDCRTKWTFNDKYDDIESKLGVYKETLNPIYKNLLTISSFDFGSELSVNILGHIFENSISDIEELKEDNTEQRKKDGVFYTPEYITDYICRNTIIPYLSLSGHINSVPELISEYETADLLDELDIKLKSIKIIDPACGSGSMLNKSVEILFEIHEALHASKYANNPSLDPYLDSLESRKQIISNNIYGVDLNEESVEITKLSLFLELATSVGVKQGFKLPNLDKNIKCGNSLIDDKNIVQNKAFNWKTNFYDEFVEGGFDIVVGNPPYVRQELIPSSEKEYLSKHYETYTGYADLYVYFFEKGINILKNGGILGFICSNKYTRVKYGEKLRKFILDYSILKYNDYSSEKVFKDATVDPSTIFIKKNQKEKNILVNESYELEQKFLTYESWSFKPSEIHNLENKIISNSLLIKNLDININRGITTGFNKAFIIDEKTKNEFINTHYDNENIIKPILKGKDIDKWRINHNDYILLIKNKEGNNLNPEIQEHFNVFKENLEKRTDKGEKYWELRPCSYYDLFEKDKIIWQRVCKEPNFTFDKNKHILLDSMAFITSEDNNYDLKYILCFLNHPITKWYLESIGHQYSNKGFLVSNQYVERLPIFPLTPLEQRPFIEMATEILDLYKDYSNELNSFRKWIKREFNIDKLSKKLENYDELTYDEFLIELEKKKVNVSSFKTQKLLETGFENSLSTIKPLKSKISTLEKSINEKIYELYNITNEEKDIIENN